MKRCDVVKLWPFSKNELFH
ncbi:hypothetical protein CAEBREN_20022 [Caenorhabditis brenneri]|uniref:Uncharacterized protein n=1 Tax=Caenorhabditis brenneri TaxID=135651 RepID=G0M7X9_CAEBE|nr:hypothetical protein CAEBREN_20022 [Caenorhabditis brenneri]